MSDADKGQLIALTANIVAGYLSRNSLSPADLPALMGTVHQSLVGLGQPAEADEGPVDLKPAVPIKKSITPDYLICLEDGKKLKTLKRHLMAAFNLTPADYRAKWGLPMDYPMTAPNYTKTRSEVALKLGLGKSRKK
ncbi:MAG: MucR family transcriptional regulator [Rhodospirillaceae bacterium]